MTYVFELEMRRTLPASALANCLRDVANAVESGQSGGKITGKLFGTYLGDWEKVAGETTEMAV